MSVTATLLPISRWVVRFAFTRGGSPLRVVYRAEQEVEAVDGFKAIGVAYADFKVQHPGTHIIGAFANNDRVCFSVTEYDGKDPC